MFEEVSGSRVEEVFEKFFLSFRLNRMKPGDEIYRKVIEEGGLIPEESLFIDDAKANIETAERLGFKTLFYDVNTNLEVELNKALERYNG